LSNSGARSQLICARLKLFSRIAEATMHLTSRSLVRRAGRTAVAALCVIAIGRGNALAAVLMARPMVPQASSDTTTAPIPADQLDSLVAPIALYPDPLLAQTLAASTYPLEIMQLQQWLTRNPGLTGKALADAVAKQPWDASIQAMAALPDVVKRLADDIQWTTDLGNAFLAQESDVMSAVQRMRQKAESTGNLKSTEQQVVETRVIENKEVIVIEQSDPQVVYVPSYNPTVVYGPPIYPYPPIYYPPAGYYAAGAAISFGVGVAMGAFWGSGGWGWNAGWGRGDIDINRNANFVRNSNINRTGNFSNTWQHNAAHRGGTPYRDRATANRYGGTARGDSLSSRASGARQQIGAQGGNLSSARSGATGTSGRTGQFSGAAGNRTAGGASVGNRAAAGGGADRVGSRDLSRSAGSGSAFGSGSRDAASARANSSRGSSSFQSQRGSYSGSRSGSFSGGSRSGGFSGSRGGGGGGRRGGGGGRR
jgi:hypothetical protein